MVNTWMEILAKIILLSLLVSWRAVVSHTVTIDSITINKNLHKTFILTDVPVWSKLETGRIPQPGEIFQIIENQMKFKPDGMK